MNTYDVHICVIQPPGYVHSLGLIDPAHQFRHHFMRLGASVTMAKNRLRHEAMNFIFGAHLGFDPALRRRYACFFVNLEQLGDGGANISPQYLELLRTSAVIDYDHKNLAAYTSHPDDVPLVSFAYAPYLSATGRQGPAALPLEHRPIDLLFIGSLNPRRIQMIEQIEQLGISVSLFDQPLYGRERDDYIRQAKAVLNCHFYESGRFEQVRISHCLSLGTPVISERTAHTQVPAAYEHALSWFDGAHLDAFFRRDFLTPAWFELARTQLDHFASTDAIESYAEVLSFATGYTSVHARHRLAAPWRPTRINIGSGRDYRLGWLNLDVLARTEPDCVLDLSNHQNLPILMPSVTCGPILIESGQIDEIHASQVLEHIPNLAAFMTQCLSLLREGGKMVITVPHEQAPTAWQDPTHVRAMNENSWLYYTDWFWYLGWFEYRFHITRSHYLDLKNSPADRAEAAFMHIELTKVMTTPHERTMARMQSASLSLPGDVMAGDRGTDLPVSPPLERVSDAMTHVH